MMDTFYSAASFNRNLGQWDIAAVLDLTNVFYPDVNLDDCNKRSIDDSFNDQNPSQWGGLYDWATLPCATPSPPPSPGPPPNTPIPPPPSPPPPVPPPPELQLTVNEGDSLALALVDALATLATGTDVDVMIVGAHELTSPVAVPATAGGQMRLVGADGATVRAAGADPTLFSFAVGAPPTSFTNLTLAGHVDSGSRLLQMDDCAFDSPGPQFELSALRVHAGRSELRRTLFSGLPAGALRLVGDAHVLVSDSVISRNNATRGAAANVTDSATLVFVRSEIEHNTATVAGGALSVGGGYVLLSNQTVLRHNTAPSGQTMSIDASGSVTYGLPAPLGHWIASPFVCEVGVCDAGGRSCDGDAVSEMLSLTVVKLSAGPVDDDYPPLCPAGTYGDSLNIEAQSGPACSGTCATGQACGARAQSGACIAECESCPRGSWCLAGFPIVCEIGSYCINGARQLCEAGSYQDEPNATSCKLCEAAHYCEPGAAAPVACAAGSTSNVTGLTDSNGCLPVVPGFWAPAGSVLPIECTSSVMLCPGAAADAEYGGARPIILEGGAQIQTVIELITEQQETWSVTATITLDRELDSTYNETAVRLELAALYGVPLSWIQLNTTAGSVVLALTIAPPQSALAASAAAGTPLATSAAAVSAAVNGASASTLTAALGATASSTAAAVTVANVSVGYNRSSDEQVSCTPGYFSPGSGICMACAPGTKANASGMELCEICEAGTYQPLKAQTACTSCDEGAYCEEGASSPLVCPPGTHSNGIAGLASIDGCVGCPLGHYCTGSSTPVPCPEQTHGGGQVNLSSPICNGTCPVDVVDGVPTLRVTLGMGTIEVSGCVCRDGLYLKGDTNECEHCPAKGSNCRAKGITLDELPLERGWWRVTPTSSDLRRCNVEGACTHPNQTQAALRRRISAATWADRQCAVGHRGPLCGACDEDFYSAALGKCERCGGSAWQSWLAVGIVLAAAVGALGFMLLRGDDAESSLSNGQSRWRVRVAGAANVLLVRARRLNSKLRICVAMYQMLTQLGTVFTIPYPAVYKSSMQIVGFVNLDLATLAPFECVFVYSHYSSLVAHTLLPAFAVSVLLLMSRLFRSPSGGASRSSERCATAAFYIVFFVYPSVSAKIFSTFNCEQFDGSFDGSDRWMRADVTVDCNAAERAGWIAYASCMILMYPLGVPTYFAYLLFVRYRAILTEQRDCEQQAAANKVLRSLQERASMRDSARGSGRWTPRRVAPEEQPSIPRAADACPSPQAGQYGGDAGAMSLLPRQSDELGTTLAAQLRGFGAPKRGALGERIDEEPSAAMPSKERRKSAVYRDTSATLSRKSAGFMSFLLDPYLLSCNWFEVFECVRKLFLVGIPVFFVNDSLEQLVLGLIVRARPNPHSLALALRQLLRAGD